MVERGGEATFPLIFYDGEREINIGNIRVQPMLEFKTFQLMISRKIGISPNQISIYQVHRNSSPEDRQRIPITGKVNFGLIARQKDCFFQVILKRSRKSKSQKLRSNGFDYGDYTLDSDYSPPSPLENVVLLRRNQPEMNMNSLQFSGFQAPFYDQITQTGLAGLNDRLHNLKIQRENYALAMAKQPDFMIHNLVPNARPDFNPYLDVNTFPRVQETMTENVKDGSKRVVICKTCVNLKKDQTSAFHHCVNDVPVFEFRRSPAGPIARPGKASI